MKVEGLIAAYSWAWWLNTEVAEIAEGACCAGEGSREKGEGKRSHPNSDSNTENTEFTEERPRFHWRVGNLVGQRLRRLDTGSARVPPALTRNPEFSTERSIPRPTDGQVIRRRFQGTPELTAAVYASLVEHLERVGLLRTLPFDAAACAGATVADLDSQRVTAFLSRAETTRGYALGPGTPVSAALAHLNLLEGEAPNHAALLLFGREPQRWLPTSVVKCLHFHGPQVRKPIPSHQVYRGTVFDLIDQAVDFVMSKINRAVGTRAESNVVPVSYELPREAVAEAIVNAVVHRDYASNASVQVMLFSDRLEVWNPGELPASLTPDRLTKPHASIPRNPLVATPLFLAGYAEHAGTGTLDMLARCQDAGLKVTPQVTPQLNTLPTRRLEILAAALGITTPQVTPQLTTQVEALLRAAVTPQSRDELQRAVGLSDRKHFREALLNPLLAARWLEMTIPEVPQSRLQRYCLAANGAAWLTEHGQSLKP